MRLYVGCNHCGFRTYLNVVEETRNDLVDYLGSQHFTIDCSYCNIDDTYSVNEIFAEKGSSTVPGGAMLGGIVGAFIGGPIGILLGGGVGAYLGELGNTQEEDRINRFNEDVV